MIRRILMATSTLGVLSLLSACGSSDDNTAPVRSTQPIASAASTPSPPTEPSPPSAPASTRAQSDTSSTSPPAPEPAPTNTIHADEPSSIAGTVVRFTANDTHVDVTITNDTRTTRDLLSMLPMTLSFEEFNGREKISYLPRALDTSGSPGSDPEDGDLIYYTPWGNLGFYYNTAGIGYSDQTIHLGTYQATAEELASLEQGDIRVEVLD